MDESLWRPVVLNLVRAKLISSTARLYGGTVLGPSAISQRIVNALGGKICVDSKPGHGSKFSFDLTFTKRTAKTVDSRKNQPDISPSSFKQQENSHCRGCPIKSPIVESNVAQE